MVRNCLAAALRHLGRNKLYSAISVFGLAVGLWAALLAALILHNQFSYDHFIPGYGRIYMAMSWVTMPGHATFYMSNTNSFVGPELKLAFSEIDAETRIVGQEVTLRRGSIQSKEKIYDADPNLFEVLPLPTIAGDLQSALGRPDSIVLSRSMARKYFGRDSPLGETLMLDGLRPMTVRAVIEDLPPNGTHLEHGIFVSGLAAWSELARQDAIPGNVRGADVSWGINTYVRLAPGASPQRLRAAMPAMARELWKAPPQGASVELALLRMDRLNTHPGLNPIFAARAIMTLVLGTVILIIACVNFVNLLTARSACRATEVAMRKISGAQRPILILQFLSESLVYVAVAMLIAVALTEWSLPSVNAFLNTGAAFDYWRDHALIGWIALAAIVLGLLAGAYPAFVLSAFRPLDVLKGTMRHSRAAGFTRQSLVTLQFALLIGLVIAAGIVYEQRIFATHEALRVDTDQMLLIRSACTETFAAELRKLGGVRGVACTNGGLFSAVNVFSAKDRHGVSQYLRLVLVDPSFFKLYGIRPLAGRLPAEAPAAQTRYYVVNETAVGRWGFASPQDAIGYAQPSPTPGEPPVVISAVIPDFSLGSVTQKIDAQVFVVAPKNAGFELIHVKLSGHDIPETLAAIDRLWTATGAQQPISRIFVNDYLQLLYIVIQREAAIFAIFSVVAVLLSCLGLLGLSASITERRTREIGIRKAMGADTGQVVRLLLWQFTKPVLWANLIAWPAVAYLMNRWLHGFAYHTNLQPWLFLSATAAAIAIALLTVSTHSILVAGGRPVAALRHE